MRPFAALSGFLGALAAGWALAASHDSLVLLLAGFFWIIGFGLYGLFWTNPLWAALTTLILGLGILWFPHHALSMTDALLAVATALIGAIAAHLSHPRQSAGLMWSDGLWAVALFVLASVDISVTQVGISMALTKNLAVLVAVYLLTPAIEAAIMLLILEHAHVVRDFVRENYARVALSQVTMGVAVGTGLAAMMGVIVALEEALAHIRVRSNNPFIFAAGLNPHTVAATILVAIAVVVVAPITEEALFRGILFGGFLTRLPYWVATIISALLFGAAHMDLTLLLPLTLAGLALNAVYRQNRSLVPSTVAHATLNGLSVMLALFVR